MLQENYTRIINSLNSSLTSSENYCSLLQHMRNQTSNNDTLVNYIVGSVLGVLSALAILENLLILWVLGFRLHQKTVSAVWVINLALSDFLATLTMPFFIYYVMTGHDWKLGPELCTVETSAFFLNMFVSSFLLAAISLDRCLLVAKPIWSQRRRSVATAWKICAVGWLWAAVNTIPYSLFRSVIAKKNDHRKLCYHNFALYSPPNALERNCIERQTATAVSKTLLAFVLPLLVIAVSYGHFGLRLQEHWKRRERRMVSLRPGGTAGMSKKPHSLSSAPSPTEHRATRLSHGFTKMVTTVIATFILCWAPYHIVCLIEVVAQYMPEKIEIVVVGLPVSIVFAFLNSLLNPIIYTFSCPHFCTRIRQSLGLLFEGLVEETGPLDLASGRRRRPPMIHMSLNSLNNLPLQRIHHVSQTTQSHLSFKRSSIEGTAQTVM